MKVREDYVAEFQDKIKNFYREHGRDFTWRKTENNLHALVAEIMLQQTSFYQVEEQYEEFAETFDNPQEVLDTPESEIRKFFEGLGLPSRAEYVIAAAKFLQSNKKANFENLMEVKGVGRYTANAYLSMHLGKRRPIVDGNVIRVFRKELDFPDDYGTQDDETWRMAWKLLPKAHVKTYNLGLIDYGAELYDGNP